MRMIRRANERGTADHGWLDARHTFSFAGYHDPAHMQFRSLRVMNEDRIAPGKGFDMHPHEDMEIITYVIEGALQHRDNMGNGSVIHAGEFQKMSAGTGVLHSEFNPSSEASTHLYQIWIHPDVKGIKPSYDERTNANEFADNAWNLIASPDAEGAVFPVAQDAKLYLGKISADSTMDYSANSGRYLWVQVISGEIELDGERLSAGDGVSIADASSITLTALDASEVMLFDLA